MLLVRCSPQLSLTLRSRCSRCGGEAIPRSAASDPEISSKEQPPDGRASSLLSFVVVVGSVRAGRSATLVVVRVLAALRAALFSKPFIISSLCPVPLAAIPSVCSQATSLSSPSKLLLTRVGLAKTVEDESRRRASPTRVEEGSLNFMASWLRRGEWSVGEREARGRERIATTTTRASCDATRVARGRKRQELEGGGESRAGSALGKCSRRAAARWDFEKAFYGNTEPQIAGRTRQGLPLASALISQPFEPHRRAFRFLSSRGCNGRTEHSMTTTKCIH
jgi:hypothetical protein